ncbi:WxL domain-containing protein [Enterococcus sp. 669A]|uniref:WxL domain-containing protein n=1 Tax=Candidatus Enterococcus moelleringii TaxID=2815325 RepID=A0ABS3L660_9ENTE|nr:adhesive domain-containing protein [Enterococcus sp. 669A]MBO1305108.1 WxL domain-containing protein [Enterococcus sp. 669A]
MAKNNAIYFIKRKILVTILLVFTVLGPILSQIYLAKEAEAAVLDIEILSNIEANNTSGTSPENRWQLNDQQEVEFVIRGSGLGSISAGLTGPKTAVLVIPPELAGSVEPTGDALIETNLTLNLRGIPLLRTLFSALDGLLGELVRILNGALGALTGVTLNLDEVYRQVDLLNSLQDLPSLSFHVPVTLSEDGRALTINVDDGLGRVLAENLKTILQNLSNAVDALRAEGQGPVSGLLAGTINGLLGPLKSGLTTAIQALFPLLDLGGSLVSALADGSLLGDTTVTISTNIQPPEQVTEDLDAHFYGSVVKSSTIDIDLLTNSSGVTSIYFEGERFGVETEQLPKYLDFGTHPIQTAEDQIFSLDEGLGMVQVEDTRNIEKNWSIKVSQASQWTSPNNTNLTNPDLTLYSGPLETTFQDGEIINHAAEGITLRPFAQQKVFTLRGSQDSGSIALPLRGAELFVPMNTPREATSYETTLVWTLSETPNE